MANWTDIIPLADVPEGEHRCTTAGDRELVVFNRGSEVYIIQNQCPHAGLPLGEGESRGNVIICPFHGYTYNIKNGRNIDWPDDELPAKTFPARVVNGIVQAQLGGDEDEAGPEDEEQPKRGPAPVENPADEPDVCEPDSTSPDQAPGTPDKDCPTGYPDRQPTRDVPQ